MEAAACGIPAIASDIPGCREIVLDGGCGAVVPLDDPTALSDTIERLARDETLRLQMGRRAVAFARSHLDQSLVFDQIATIYASLWG